MKFLTFVFIILVGSLSYSQSKKYIIEKLSYHNDKVNTVSFSFDGKYLASGSEDKYITIINVEDYSKLLNFEAHYGPVKDLHFIKTNNHLYSAGDKVIKKWNMSGEQLNLFKGSATFIWSFCISNNEKMIAGGAYENYIRIWNAQNEEMIAMLKGHEKSTLAVSISNSGKYIASGSLDKTVKIWNAETFEIIHTFEGHNDNIYALNFSSDDKYLLSASNDNTIKVWNIDKMAFEITLTGHEKGILSAEFSPDGYHIISGSIDHTIKLWERKSGDCIYTFEYHDEEINDVTFHPNGKLFASASSDNKVVIWDLNPEIFVYHYYQEEYFNELENSGFWGPKRKGESSNDYKERQLKAEEIQLKLIDKYYEKYLIEKLTK
ncbi:WD40 repeat domain-containing protein [Bacteroidota bacterium]